MRDKKQIKEELERRRYLRDLNRMSEFSKIERIIKIQKGGDEEYYYYDLIYKTKGSNKLLEFISYTSYDKDRDFKTIRNSDVCYLITIHAMSYLEDYGIGSFSCGSDLEFTISNNLSRGLFAINIRSIIEKYLEEDIIDYENLFKELNSVLDEIVKFYKEIKERVK